MKKSEKIFSMFVLIGLLVLITYGLWRTKKIDENPIFVLGKITKVSESENGLIYDFIYTFEKNEYKNHMKGFVKMRDSLVFIKISKNNPNLCKVLNNEESKCLILKDSINGIWEELQNCK